MFALESKLNFFPKLTEPFTGSVLSLLRTMSSSYRVAKPTQRTPTCDTCKSRHQKCSGEKPQCSNCKLRGIECAYSTARPRMPENSRSSESIFAPPTPLVFPKSSSNPTCHLTDYPFRLNRRSISDADYNQLYAEIFGDIVCQIQNLGLLILWVLQC